MARTLIAIGFMIIASGFVAAEDKASARAKAALALQLELQKAPPVDAIKGQRTPEQAAKAALAEALGRECDCGMCDKAKPMPAAPKKDPAKVETLTYSELSAAVLKLKQGESIRVYVNQDVPKSATGRCVRLKGKETIPGEPQLVGVWRCWMEDGKPKMQSWHPDDKPKRVIISGRYYDQYSDGTLFWCVECNRGLPLVQSAQPQSKVVSQPISTVAGHSHRCSYDGTVWSHADRGLTYDDHYCPTCGREERVQYQQHIQVAVRSR